jgi:hypothetical protein
MRSLGLFVLLDGIAEDDQRTEQAGDARHKHHGEADERDIAIADLF